MYRWSRYGTIGLAIFTDAVSMDELRLFAEDVASSVGDGNEFFVIALPMPGSQFPKQISELAKVVSEIKRVKGMVTRYYGVKQDPIMSFIANTISSIFGIRGNTIEANNIEALYALLLKEAETFSGLKASIGHLDAIKANVAGYSKTAVKPR